MPPNIEEQHNTDLNSPSPSPIEYENDTINVSPSYESTNHDSQPDQSQSNDGKKPQHARSTFLDRLEQMPVLRAIPWRKDQELPAKLSSDSERVQKRGGALLATRGDIVAEACTQCVAGRGRFAHCIALGNWFQGACASCVFTSRGIKCGLRAQKGKVVDGRNIRHLPVEEGGMNEEPRSKRRRTQSHAKDPELVSENQPPLQIGSQHPFPAAAPPQYAPDMVQTQIVGEEANRLLGYVHNMEKKQKRYRNGFQDESARYNEPPNGDRVMRGYANGFRANGPSSPLSAGSQPHQNGRPQPASRDMTVGAPAQNQNDGGQPVPIIDTLPKSKQRQIFGLISGIQGGIDSLQRQLNLLQDSLGIDRDERAF